MNRQRCFHRPLGLAALVLMATAAVAAAAEPSGVYRLTVAVRETAGIRRFGYPVSTVLRLAVPVKDVEHMRLLEHGKPVVAQFRPHGDTSKAIRAVSLDFNVNHGPHDSRRYVVEYGPDVKPPRPARGMKVVTEADQFRVVHSPSLQFIVPRNLLGLLRGVKTDRSDYLRPGSAGLMILSRDNVRCRAGSVGPHGKPPVARVVKQGPLASTLRFESTEALRGGRSVASVMEMEFPVSKSWVRVTWTVDDPHGYVAGLGADLNLNIQGEPALVDFGASSYVYAHLRKGQTAILRQYAFPNRGRLSWETLVGPAASPTPYVVARYVNGQTIPRPVAEGWAHVMDRRRCTAVGVADFASEIRAAEIAVHANGRLLLGRKFGRAGHVPKGPKKLRFWLHFVDMPVQVGAITSPQSMMAPLSVKVEK